MPDREQDELERYLRELGSRVEYPPTPDLARAVRRRLDEEPAGRRHRSRLRALAKPGWIAAAAVTALLASATLWAATSPIGSDFSVSSGAGGGAGQAAGGARGAPSAETAPEAADRSGRTAPDAASAGASAGASVAPSPGAALGLGERLSAPEARARVGELPLPGTPELASGPRAIYAGGPSPSDGAVLVFGPGPGLPPLGDTGVGLLLAEVPADLRSAYPSVERTSGSPPEEVDVGGNPGHWIPDGRSLSSQPGDAENLPGGALIWQQGDASLLLRAAVTRDEALRIAESIR